VIVFKVSKSPTLLEEEPVPEWELSLFLKSEKNIQIELWKLSPYSHPQKSPIPLSNHITLLFQYINLLKTLMKSKLLITKPYMIYVSELLNWPPQPTVI